MAERVGSTRLRRRAERLAEALGWRAAAKAYAEAAREAPPGAYQRRRDVNVERLNRVDRLIAVSERVAEIYALLGVDRDRIVTRVPTLRHIESLRPRRAGGGIVTFATLGGGESVAKGSELLLDAVRSLAGSTPPERYRVLVFGHVHRDVNAALAATPGVELRGPFRPDQVNDLLEEVDVGIVPSIWEEAYGLVGPEFLAKGIPLIANSIGGINEYAREGQTAWLNRTCTADGLAALMRHVIEHPDELAELRERTLAARASLVAPVPQHAVEVDAVYREAIGARGARMPKLVA